MPSEKLEWDLRNKFKICLKKKKKNPLTGYINETNLVETRIFSIIKT